MDAAWLVGEQVQDLGATVLGVKVLGAQIGVVQGLDPDLCAADEVRHVDQLGERKATRRRAMQDVGDLGGAVAGKVEMLGRGPHLRTRKLLECEAAVGLFLEIFAPLREPLRLKVLGPDEIGDLDFEFLLRAHDGRKARDGGCACRTDDEFATGNCHVVVSILM